MQEERKEMFLPSYLGPKEWVEMWIAENEVSFDECENVFFCKGVEMCTRLLLDKITLDLYEAKVAFPLRHAVSAFLLWVKAQF